MYKINFNHLYYFLTISNEGSIVKAAKKLNVSQPALSHQLKLLEEDLEQKLFDRVGKRLKINQHGEYVREYARKIFRHSEEMIHLLKSDSTTFIKIIKIGTVPWVPNTSIYEFIKPYLMSNHIRVEVVQKDLDSLMKDVSDGKIDIILCDSPYSGRSKKLQGHRLSIDKIVCVSSSKKGLSGKFPKSINGKKVVSYSETCMMNDKIDQFITKSKISIQDVGTFSDLALIKTTLLRSRIIGFLPYDSVKGLIREKLLFKIGELKDVKFSLWAITQKSSNKNSLVSELLDKAIKDSKSSN
tara:strand:- start:62381 stop:63274 length:894 start_codon:yes stop_codon:yes gene_type:complete